MHGRFKDIAPGLRLLFPCAALLLNGAPAFARSPTGTPAYVDFNGNGKDNVFVWRNSEGVWNVSRLSGKSVDVPILRDVRSLSGQIVSAVDGGHNAEISLKIRPTRAEMGGSTEIAEIDLTLAPATSSSACAAKGCTDFYYQVASSADDTATYCAVFAIYGVSPAAAERAIQSEYRARSDYIIARMGKFENLPEACGATGA